MAVDLDQITLAILAGGEGSRMGKPKGLLEIAGVPILQYLLDRFRWPGPTMLVTAPGREPLPASEMFLLRAVDAVPGQGPLRGILTALDASATPHVAIVTVDMPEVGAEQLQWLLAQLIARPAAMGIMIRRSQKIEPFPAAFRREAASVIQAQLEEGVRSVHALTKMPEIIAADCPADWPQRVWTNLNDPQDLRDWLESR